MTDLPGLNCFNLSSSDSSSYPQVSFFLVGFSHLYRRPCRSVFRSVGPSSWPLLQPLLLRCYAASVTTAALALLALPLPSPLPPLPLLPLTYPRSGCRPTSALVLVPFLPLYSSYFPLFLGSGDFFVLVATKRNDATSVRPSVCPSVRHCVGMLVGWQAARFFD